MPYKNMRAAISCAALVFSLSHSAEAAVIAELRQDYDSPSSPHSNGATAAGKIPDTNGGGSWTFFGRSVEAPGGSQTALVYSTTANIVRTANAYVLPGGSLDLPAISNLKLIDGPFEDAPSANELALHPGNGAVPFLVIRWTAGAGEAGIINLSGAIRDFGSNADGVTFQIYNQSGISLTGGQLFTDQFNNPGSQASLPFDIETSVAAGDFIDFVVGPNTYYDGDHSAISITVTAIPEPSAATLGLAGVLIFLTRRSRRTHD